ncbi:cytochrome c oxidase subunit 4 [Spongisporangium articulatum]|uniref:Cytochrome c oxidase polypeptide 4 n=1 Tax=Spongisporangium articulatum TaxID=3362603 RepID=A0ABW8ASX4_9ACTN
MKVTALLFWLGTIIFAVTGVVYGVFATDWEEPVGVVALFLTAGLALMIAVYLSYTDRHTDDLPEDDTFGEIEQGAGELGEFAPYSWWPLVAAGGGAVVFAGAAIGWWLLLIGLGLGAIGVIGWVFEFYRGEHAH